MIPEEPCLERKKHEPDRKLGDRKEEWEGVVCAEGTGLAPGFEAEVGEAVA